MHSHAVGILLPQTPFYEHRLIFHCLCLTGINTTYGVFSSYYIENNYYKASQLEYAWVGGMSVAVAYICGPPANYLTDRFNFRVPMLLGEYL